MDSVASISSSLRSKKIWRSFNYFTHRSNSGWVEGLNNKIKVLKRRCYGIANSTSLFRRIWLDLSGYEAFAH
jgi:transposase